MLITLGTFKPDEVFDFVPDSTFKKIKSPFVVDGQYYEVKVSSDRLVCFKRNRKCVCCGLEGNKFLLQKSETQPTPHFNFYSDDILMTKDHITAISNGGRNHIDNYQTMCKICNEIKAHFKININVLKDARNMFNSGISRVDIEKFLSSQG